MDRIGTDSRWFANGRPTIAFLTESIVDRYHAGLWEGLRQAAAAQGCNLLCIAGGSLGRSPYDPWETARNDVYRLAQRGAANALIVSMSLGNFVSARALERFLAPLRRLPMVCLGPHTAPGLPSVGVDNHAGMRALVDHLAGSHAFRRFAFVNGPGNNREAAERLDALRLALRRRGLALAPELVFEGDFTMESGARAVRAMLESGAQADALIGANDLAALGALEALRKAGRPAPERIAVAGFDGIEEGRYDVSPLTTVAQPLEQLGAAALRIALKLAAGGRVPQHTALAPALTVRRSCGCAARSLERAAGGRQRRKRLRDLGCVAALRRDAADSGSRLAGIVERLGREELALDHAPEQWHAALHAMGAAVCASLRGARRARAERSLHEAAAVLGELQRRQEGRWRTLLRERDDRVRRAAAVLQNTLDTPELLAAVGRELPGLGVRAGHLFTYRNGRRRAVRALAFGPDATPLAKPGSRTPRGRTCLATGGQPQCWAMMPLHYHEERLGYALLDAAGADMQVIDQVCEAASGALHSSLLMGRVRAQAAELAALRAKELEHLELIRRELERGRRIQRAFLPDTLPSPPGWDVAAAFVPAREVSGDTYDLRMLDDRTMAFAVADVSGKNVGAALVAGLVHALMHVFGEQAWAAHGDPFAALPLVNEYVLRHRRRQAAGEFVYVTMVYGTIDCAEGTVRWANAGHVPPLVLGPGGILGDLGTTGPALGLAPGARFEVRSRTLAQGSELLAFTDGLTDARALDGGFFGAQRLWALAARPEPAAGARIETIRNAVTAFAGGEPPYDDLTMVAIRRTAAAASRPLLQSRDEPDPFTS